MKKTKISAMLLTLSLIFGMFSYCLPASADSVMQLSNCDSLDGWEQYPGDGMALEQTEKTEGTGSLRLFQTGGFSACYKLSQATDLTGMKYFVFDFYTVHDDWFQVSEYPNLVISSRVDEGGFEEQGSADWTEQALIVSLKNVSLTSGWNTVNVPIDFSKGAAGFNEKAVTKFMIYGLAYYKHDGTDGTNTEYIDNVRAATSEQLMPGQDSTAVRMWREVYAKANDVYNNGKLQFTDESWQQFNDTYLSITASIPDPTKVDEATLLSSKKTLQRSMNSMTVSGNENGAIDQLYDRVVVLGIDGMGSFDTKAETPNLDRLAEMDDVLYTHHANSVIPTISAENWSSMLLGVTPAKHGNTNDSIASTVTPDNQKYPSVFKYIRNKYPNAELTSFNNWTAINNGVIEHNIGVNMYSGDDDVLTDNIISYFNENDPLYTFVQFDSVDHAGHSSVYGSQTYLDQIAVVDGYVGRIYDALEANGYLDSTLFMVVTDHGGINYGHGGTTDQEVYVSYYAKGRNVTSCEYTDEIYTASLSAVSCAALGVKESADYDYKLPAGYFTNKPVDNTLYGDVNSDKKVDSADALAVLQASVHLNELSDEAKKAADVNVDNEVNTCDALLILQKTVGKIDKFKAEE